MNEPSVRVRVPSADVGDRAAVRVSSVDVGVVAQHRAATVGGSRPRSML